jgi:hypothetical protein
MSRIDLAQRILVQFVDPDQGIIKRGDIVDAMNAALAQRATTYSSTAWSDPEIIVTADIPRDEKA